MKLEILKFLNVNIKVAIDITATATANVNKRPLQPPSAGVNTIFAALFFSLSLTITFTETIFILPYINTV